MERTGTLLAVALLSVIAFGSCKMINSVLHDEEVVAKVGNNMLYKSDVVRLIPSGIPSDDSLRLAMQYINSWASDMVFLEIAENQLSKAQKDVSKELETYRRSLLKYRYEQMYVNERLDTAVTDDEVDAYFSRHQEEFRLKRPVVKVRYMKILPESPDYDQLKELMSIPDEDMIWNTDGQGYSSVDRLTDYDGAWIDASVLADDMDVDYQSIAPLSEGKLLETVGKDGKHNLAYILEIVQAGEIPPVEFCRKRIEDIIISTRKHNLTTTLEQELLKDARDKGKFVIY